MPVRLTIDPPLLNSATPWATDLNDLMALAACPSTGAVTTRTSLIKGFDHQDANHRYLFFDPATAKPDEGTSSNQVPPAGHTENATASLNNLGYSPIPLEGYIKFLKEVGDRLPTLKKTFIVSVTGSPEDILASYELLESTSKVLPFPLAMEVNLSCPNIPGAPPPAYHGAALEKYLSILPKNPAIPIGIKTPPYTYEGQFASLIDTLVPAASSISFITATNTLGSCLILEQDGGNNLTPQLPNLGVGGMAGPPLHALALGNVSTLRRFLTQTEELKHIAIIGVGGVRDGDGFRRMRAVGAKAVAVGTALGKQGVNVFQRIERDVDRDWKL